MKAVLQQRDSTVRRYPVLLIGTAVFGLCWAVARAAVQSITIDEADTYLSFVATGLPFWPSSNNHVLNSWLMGLTTTVFGLSPITVRLPALLGAAFFICAAFYLCVLITSSRLLRWALFVCLVYNPFVFDFLVAARGYSLALAFLAWAVAIPAGLLQREAEPGTRSLLWTCAASSICAGLAFAANFSVAFAAAGLLAMISLWICRRSSRSRAFRKVQWANFLAACIIPGLLLAALLCARTILAFPKSQLFYGAQSLGETFKSLIGPTLFELNPHLLNSRLYAVVAPRRNLLLPVLGAALLFQLVVVYHSRRMLRGPAIAWRFQFAAVLTAGTMFALGVHWAGFHWFGLLLPKDRSGLYIVLAVTLTAGLLAAVCAPTKLGRISQRALLVMLCVMAGYFILCLRLTYFREWRYGADVNRVYTVVANYTHSSGIGDIPSHWFYAASLNFYRKLAKDETIAEFRRMTSNPIVAKVQHMSLYPDGKPLYILYYPEDQGFIEKSGLRVVYHGEISDIVVAVRPASGESIPPAPEPIHDPVFWNRYRQSLQDLKRGSPLRE